MQNSQRPTPNESYPHCLDLILQKRKLPYITDILSHLFILIILSVVVPDKLEIRKGNYRHISLLCIFSKILKNVMKLKVVNILDENNFFYAN